VRRTCSPERTVYALTETGRAELFDWLHALMAEPRHEYPHFGVALSLLSIIPPEDGVALLRRRLEALSDELAEIRANVRAAGESGVLWVFLVEED
jgi:DNA-binding PadR family transcriptional regulator